ncbi:hypothetical protein HanRHA438_Chr05g0237061 [Helianthus annuus]|uniref:Uncharacterized protein n=1 Tax=Helianthus annuus TaxID=4232 RepID=A0A9K3J384_HELAN|nr:hypothetical protein HanXRQr2_Chr05g0227911 [Helianthus annuus]KAJ0920090.1 hypothetical protein HanRHA438_Chr05g0237061 [Helianthus annuus]
MYVYIIYIYILNRDHLNHFFSVFLVILLPLSIFFLVLFLKFMVLGHQYKCSDFHCIGDMRNQTVIIFTMK